MANKMTNKMTIDQKTRFNNLAQHGADQPLVGDIKNAVYTAVEEIWSNTGESKMNMLNRYTGDESIDIETREWIGYIAVEGDEQWPTIMAML